MELSHFALVPCDRSNARATMAATFDQYDKSRYVNSHVLIHSAISMPCARNVALRSQVV